MLFILKNTTNGDLFYLIDKDIFFVGRKECDLLIQDDQSISRKHAKVFIKGSKAVITDLGSKYKTLCNDVELIPNVETTLHHNDEIKFGVLNSKFRLEVHSLITTGTRLNSSLKEQVKKDIAFLGGEYSENWHIGCTYLTVHEITLTIKVLQALVDKKPIVTPSYWSDFLKNARHNKNFPDTIKYMPPMAEALLNKIELQQGLDRTHLFDGKVFLFMNENTKKSLEDVIQKAGGISHSWEKKPMNFKDILNSPKEILIIQTPDSDKDSIFVNIIQKLKEKGKRPIPLQELALAVALGNCEKNCNPNFNRTAEVFKTDYHKKSMHDALVENTQSECYTLGTMDVQGGNVVSDTFDNSQQNNHSKIQSDSQAIEVDKEKAGKRLRPEKDPQVDRISNKRIKTEEMVQKKIVSKDNHSNIRSASHVADISLAKDEARKRHSTEKDRKVDRTSNKMMNIEEMVLETLISKSTTKRKAQEDPQERGKSTDRTNPFMLKRVKNENTTKSTKSYNPFAGMLKNNNVGEVNKENPFNLTIQMEEEKPNVHKLTNSSNIDMGSTLHDKTSEYSRSYKSDVSSMWMSKKSISYSKAESIDSEMQSFVDLFQGVVVTEIVPKETIMRQKQLYDEVDKNSNIKNFKKFKKQYKINPRIPFQPTLVAVDPDNTTNIFDNRQQFKCFDDAVNQKVVNKKKSLKKFLI